MENPFNLSQEKLIELISGYDIWLKSDPREAKYPEVIREQSKKIKGDFLNSETLQGLNDDELYERIYKYSRNLEGRVHRTLGGDILHTSIKELRRNLLYILSSKDNPFIIAQNILEGTHKIKSFAKAFWSPILLAQFPGTLPNWNNKTEDFLNKLGINITTSKLSISEKYRKISDAFAFLSGLTQGHDFYTTNHLMHYGTAVKGGIDLIAKLQGTSATDPVHEMIRLYKSQIRKTKLQDELYKWELLKIYGGRPDLEAPDFSSEIKSLDFENLVYPMAKAVRNFIADGLPAEYRECFVKLFNEGEDLSLRVKGFMNDVFTVYRKLEGKLEHHHDERTISVFLTYHNPEKYTFFKDAFYQKYCKMTGVETKPKGEKYAHYLELISDLMNDYILPDTKLINLVKGFMNTNCFEDPNHLILAQDILYQMLDKDEEEPLVEEPIIHVEKTPAETSDSLNTIFYGPPGTGKTYQTIDYAVKIAASERYIEGNHINNKVIYEELIREGRIVFTTFHQSMCYEDFIEGIKPVSDDTGCLTYRVEDGLFKHLAVNAAFEYINDKSSDASKSLSFSVIYDRLLDEVNEKIGNNEKFILKLKSGSEIEIVDITSGNNFLLQHTNGSRTYIVSRNRLEKLFSELPELTSISNINEEIRKVIGGSNASAYWAVLKKLRSFGEVVLLKKSDKIYSYADKVSAVGKLQINDISHTGKEKKYVLVIDEINRGNVSRIFGELITLIEDDKRFGNEESLCAKLPYSRSRFFVPPNLYILGTMNTADRSVEALDTALRRRFSFIEKMPLYNLEGMEHVYAGVALKDLLETINNRIEKLVDRDHQIGHSYFLGLKNTEKLMVVFRDKIIPLLQEYFYGNYEKMGLVLGSGFVIKLPDKKVTFARFPADENEYNDKVIYRINMNSLEDLSEFTRALSELMNKKQD